MSPGVSFLTVGLEGKRLWLLRDLLPRVIAIGALMDPNGPESARQLNDVQDASRIGFATVARERPDALIVVPTPFFTAQRKRIVELAARHSLPAMYGLREFPGTGGLISYGTSTTDAFRQAGIYAGRVLKGEKPADMPVLQPTKCELVINLKTARRWASIFRQGCSPSPTR
jgi:putative ABC transport system substrate-binding protein